MGATPHVYAKHIRRLYDERPELRWEIMRDVLTARRGANVVARAGWLIAEHQYNCPRDFAIGAWKRLSGTERWRIDFAVALAVNELKEELCLN
jgi:hypothetical protein